MIAGRLTERIDIYTPKIVIDDFGSQHTEYIFKFSTRAERVRISGNREIDNNEMFYGELKQFSIRRYHPIENFDIIHYREKKYRILDIEYIKGEQRKILKCQLINE